MSYGDEGRDWSHAAASQGMSKIAEHHQKLWRGKEGFHLDSQKAHNAADISISRL